MAKKSTIDALVEAALAGKSEIQHYLDDISFHHVSTKENGSLITDADKASEEAIIRCLEQTFPGVSVLSEETNNSDSDLTEGEWLVLDPLDGTTNFTRGIDCFSISIALVVNGESRAGIVMPICAGHYYAAMKESFSFMIDLKSGQEKTLKCFNRPLEKSILCITCDQNDKNSRKQWWEWMKKLRPPICFRVRIIEAAALELCWIAEGKLDGYLHPSDKAWDVAAGSLVVKEAGGNVFGVHGQERSFNENGILAFTPMVTKAIMDIIK